MFGDPDDQDQESTPDEISEEVENSQEEVEEQPDDEQQANEPEGGYNPVWEPLRQELGLQFEAIKPHLATIDKNFNDHVTKTNSKYEPWKQFDSNGVTPDRVTQAIGLAQKIEEAPEEIYKALGEFLEQNGRLPKNEAEAAKAVEDAKDDGDDDDEYLSPEQKELKELRQQLNDFRTMTEAQQDQARQEELNRSAEAEVAAEYKAFQDAHPNLDPADWEEIQRRHYFYALQGPESMKSLEQVGQEFFALSERLRSAPRPTDKAPRLPGAGGSVPSASKKDPSEYTSEESQEALAALIMQANQQ